MKRCRNGKSKILTPIEYRLLEKELPQKFRVLLKLCCLSGFRIGEALSIRRDDLVDNTVTVRKIDTKGALETRQIPIPEDLSTALDALPKEGPYFFPGRDSSKPMTRQNADYVLRNACKEVGIVGFSWHGTRRYFINTLHHSNVPLKIIQKAVGHRHLSSTSRYIDVEPEHIKQAVSLLWQGV